MSQNYAENTENQASLIEALKWHIDHGADELLMGEPIDRTVMPEIPKPSGTILAAPSPLKVNPDVNTPAVPAFQDNVQNQEMMGAAEALVEAQKLAEGAETLEALSQAIKEFDGLSVRKTATNMVFADGNPESDIMVIGEAPSAEDDVQGKPFIGVDGQLLDKILASIDLSRNAEDMGGSAYLSNILNWRPPGNRTPTQAELNISLPFIERHIALIKPKIIILCGGLVAKTLLRKSESISKLRGDFHDYQIPDNLNIGNVGTIPTVVTYHPTYLLRTPAQKKAVWADMLMLKAKLNNCHN